MTHMTQHLNKKDLRKFFQMGSISIESSAEDRGDYSTLYLLTVKSNQQRR